MKTIQLNSTDRMLICDTSDEFATYAADVRSTSSLGWQGGMSNGDAVRATRNGHTRSVEASEEFMAAFEHLSFRSRKFSVQNAIAGGAPNVGAHLAGSPLSMRRRQREVTNFAPLIIFCDMVSSAGISASTLMRRGAAAVALARMLSATRPVTVYGVAGMGNGRTNGFGMVKLPIEDLSRSAFVLSHTAAQRGLMYGSIHKLMGAHHGQWACGGHDRYRSQALGIFSKAVNANPEDGLYVAAPYMDESMEDVTAWLNEMLAKYGVAEEV